jgi:hypothetical protein
VPVGGCLSGCWPNKSRFGGASGDPPSRFADLAVLRQKGYNEITVEVGRGDGKPT